MYRSTIIKSGGNKMQRLYHFNSPRETGPVLLALNILDLSEDSIFMQGVDYTCYPDWLYNIGAEDSLILVNLFPDSRDCKYLSSQVRKILHMEDLQDGNYKIHAYGYAKDEVAKIAENALECVEKQYKRPPRKIIHNDAKRNWVTYSDWDTYEIVSKQNVGK